MVLATMEMNVPQLTEAIVPFIKDRGYSDSYVDGLQKIYHHLNAYCTENDIERFSAEVGQNFLQDYMLSDFQHFGAVMTRRKLDKTLPDNYSVHVEAYLTNMKHDYASDNTLASHRKGVFRFTDFISSRGVAEYGMLTIDDINAYVRMTLCNYAKSSAQTYFGILRCFLRYLYKKDITTEDFSNKVISANRSQQATHLPSTLTQEQIPMGKRDYAILLLAARLGLRVSDIRNLKETDFDWDGHKLSITQVKTGEPLVLPIPNDVGWAVIDYLKNARPTGDSLPDSIFLRVTAPYEPLKNLDNVFIRYMREAKIPYERLTHHGLHILRHSLATHMLDEGIDISTIQGILGHINIDTTRKYTGINVRQLKECAQEVD